MSTALPVSADDVWPYLVAPTEDSDRDTRASIVQLATRVVVLMCAYFLVERWTMAMASLGESSYREASILWSMRHSLAQPKTLLPALGIAALSLARPIGLRWTDIDNGRWVRVFVLVPAFLLAWTYSTYDLNLFFGRAHLTDRALLWVFFALAALRPVFVLPFTLLTTALLWQLHVPIGGFSASHPMMPVKILMLFIASFFLLVVSRRRNAVDFVFCALCLIAASYFTAGFGKIRIDWITYGHLYHLLPATYTNGWLAFVDQDAISSVVRGLSHFDWPMRLTALTLECGSLLLFWRRRLAVALLAGWAGFHAGVFGMSGICFWMWITMDALLAIFLWRRERARVFELFTPARFVLSLALIAGGARWFEPVNLSWFDARTSYTYRFEAVMDDGERFTLSPQFFAPYDYQFTLGGFGYLSEHPALPIVWGATFSREVAERLLQCESSDDIFALEAELGSPRARPERADRFDDFIATVIRRVEARGSKHGWWRPLRAPSNLWSLTPQAVFWEQGRVASVVVRELTSDWNGQEYAVIRDRVVHEVELPSAAGDDLDDSLEEP